jgi:Flp pilus assembly protein CpaB
VSSRRTLILVGAIVVGVIAALLIYNYVQGIEDRANNNAKLADVYVAKSDIKRGTPGEQAAGSKQIDKSQIPQQFRPATAITTTDQLAKKVALFDIPANSVIVEGMFVDPATSQITFRERLKNPNHVAISISTDAVHGVGGFLVPGDEVNMMVFQEVSDAMKAGSAPTDFVQKSVARYLYQKVQLLAVGQSTVLAPGETVDPATQSSQNNGVLTVNVPPDAALWIAQAQTNGGLYLSLVGKDYAPRVVPPPPAFTKTLPGEDPAVLTPYGPNGNTDQ